MKEVKSTAMNDITNERDYNNFLQSEHNPSQIKTPNIQDKKKIISLETNEM